MLAQGHSPGESHTGWHGNGLRPHGSAWHEMPMTPWLLESTVLLPSPDVSEDTGPQGMESIQENDRVRGGSHEPT